MRTWLNWQHTFAASRIIMIMALTSLCTLVEAKSLQTWRDLREGRGTIEGYQDFVKKHPNWPDIENILKRGEQKILEAKLSPKRDVAWFDKHPPQTSQAYLRYLDALKASRAPVNKMNQEIRKAWRESIDLTDEKDFWKKWGPKLQAMDDRITREDFKWREYRFNMLGTSSPVCQKLKTTVHQSANNYPKIVTCLKAKQYDEAHRLLKTVLKDIRSFPNLWWKVRHAVARECVEKENWKEALECVQNHGLPEGTEDWATAEWTRGWFLWNTGQFTEAYRVFTHAHSKVRAPVSKSRMGFWAAESAKSAGMNKEAITWHTKNAHYAGSFYGQLSLKSLGQVMPNLFWGDTAGSDATCKKDDLYHVIADNTLTKEEMLLFFKAWLKHLHKTHDPCDPVFAFVVRLAHQKGGDIMAVAVMRLVNFVSPRFVRKAFPTLPGVDPDIAALVNAIAWREGGFDSNAVSSAGAVGLMQIMPATFELEKKKMTNPPTGTVYNPSANIAVGTHIIKRLTQMYPHVLLMLGAYNAGEDPANRWQKMFGVPPSMDGDPLSIAQFVEKIPYHETRNYMQRVMEKKRVYEILLAT